MKQRCAGHSSRTGEPCKLWPVKGATVCHKHGASAKQVRAKAALRVAEQQARGYVETYGVKIETTATEALLDEVKWTAGHVAYLRDQVRKVEEDDLVWGKTQTKVGGDDAGVTEAAEPNVWLRLYQAERTHLVRVCEAAIRCGIEERRVRLAEQHGNALADLIRSILDALNLTAEQWALVPEVVPRLLRAAAA